MHVIITYFYVALSHLNRRVMIITTEAEQCRRRHANLESEAVKSVITVTLIHFKKKICFAHNMHACSRSWRSSLARERTSTGEELLQTLPHYGKTLTFSTGVVRQNLF